MNARVQQGHQLTVLLVEDDEMVRDAVTRNLVRRGYFVLTAATAHDAIGLLRTPDSQIDVIKNVCHHKKQIRGILAQKPLGVNYQEA